MLRHIGSVLLIALLAVLARPAAAQTDALYSASFIVTGQGEANRAVGIREDFGRVLVKLSGDPTVVDDPRFAALAANAPALVKGFRYRDLLEGKPIHDEQGSYDRPHALTVTFDAAGTDAALAAVGRKPWSAPRPRLFVLLGVEAMRATFMLTADGTIDRSADMRTAFAAAGDRMGMTVAFPTESQIQASGLTAPAKEASAPKLAGAAQAGDVVVTGHMIFSEEALGWIAEWRMEQGGKAHSWSVRGVNFDAAFRTSVFGAAQILSGNGEPRE